MWRAGQGSRWQLLLCDEVWLGETSVLRQFGVGLYGMWQVA